MYQSKQRSTDLCTDSYIHSTQYSFCGGNCLRSKFVDLVGGGCDTHVPCVALGYTNPYADPAGRASLYFTAPYLFYYASPVRQMSYSIPRLSRKDAGIYCTVGSEPTLYLYVIQCTVYLFF
jgi:hypothetical protein